MEEARWRCRQLEKELGEANEERERVQQAAAELEAAAAESKAAGDAALAELEQRLEAGTAENAALKEQVGWCWMRSVRSRGDWVWWLGCRRQWMRA